MKKYLEPKQNNEDPRVSLKLSDRIVNNDIETIHIYKSEVDNGPYNLKCSLYTSMSRFRPQY